MRPSQKSNRSRGRGNRKGGGGGNNINRVYDSAGPEGKVRGTPQQIIDKYLSLARDAQTSGDRVTAENFLQHAEHYQRILIQATQAQEQARREAEPATHPDPQPVPVAEGASNGETAQSPLPVPPVAAEQPEIGGMAMIDAGSEPESLVVAAVAEDEKPARGNGDARKRSRRKPAAEAADPAGEEAPAAES